MKKAITQKLEEAGKTITQIIASSLREAKFEKGENDKSKTAGLKDCPKCNGLGFIIHKENGCTIARECECYTQNLYKERFERSEIGSKDYTFKNYIVKEDWQKEIKDKAKRFVDEFKTDNDIWFYIGGQVGAGKTHICTAILKNIGYMANISFMYIKCDEELKKLKQKTFGDEDQKEKYDERLDKLKKIDLLFIDDVFKKEPTEADKSELFDIINYRYLNNKACIFSSENTLQELLSIDEAIASRIFEKCKKKFEHSINRDVNKNYRLK